MLNGNADSLLNTLSELNEIVKIHDTVLVNRQFLNLKEQVQRAVAIVSAMVEQTNAQILVDIFDGIAVLFNPSYMESILVNLITNSIKYRNPMKPLVIQVSASQTTDKTVIKFGDNGLGIDMKLYGNKLFGMYNTFHGNQDARGMGLFLVKSQVEAMGGQVTVESAPGAGTTFTIKV